MAAIILNCVAILGLILIIMGMSATFMFVFGIGKVKVGGRNRLQYKIKGTEVGIVTSHIYFAIFLGLLMVITPFSISGLFGDLARTNAEEKATPITPKLEKGEYTIREEEIRIDLRKRKEIGIGGYLAGELSETERLVRIVIEDVKAGVKKVSFRYSTSVQSIAVMNMPEDAEWTRTTKEEYAEFNPFIDLLEKKGLFKKLLARKGRMRSYYMTVPITDGSGQEIIYRLRYYNAFQGDDFEWASKNFSTDTDALTMHITFPDDKPFKSFETYKRRFGAKEIIRINNPEIETSSGNHILTWTIRDAKKGEKYFIKWLWQLQGNGMEHGKEDINRVGQT